MAQNQLYTNVVALLNGSLLTEASRVRVNRNLDAQEVKTLIKGLAGITPGAPMMRIEIDSAVPAADFEVNPAKFMLRYEEVELTLVIAGRQLTAKGWIIDDNFEMAVSSTATLSFTFIAPMEDYV